MAGQRETPDMTSNTAASVIAVGHCTTWNHRTSKRSGILAPVESAAENIIEDAASAVPPADSKGAVTGDPIVYHQLQKPS